MTEQNVQNNKKTEFLKECVIYSKYQNKSFINFSKNIINQSKTRELINFSHYIPEIEILPLLLKEIKLSEKENKEIFKLAYKLAKKIRKKNKFSLSGSMQRIIQEFSLSSKEGVALMSLSEALLRIPDKQTKEELIEDKITNKNWKNYIKQDYSFLIKLISISFIIIEKIFNNKSKIKLTNILYKIIKNSTKPIIRNIINKTMKLIGKQFIISEKIKGITKKRNKNKFNYSYDILGESALTENEAKKYIYLYQKAIEEIGKKSIGKDIYSNSGISIKLSALHPRYCRAQYQRVIKELYPRLLQLTLQAKNHNISINIDAEESDKLEISLDLFKKLSFERKLLGWNGIGFVVQSYQKRCLYVIKELIEIAKKSQHKIMIRLVKGAYWDSEIKKTQINGFKDYPVYTKKIHTDISYLACAKKLLSVPDLIYPQFATHNTQTLSSIYHIAGKNYFKGQYEFQCLYGMGENLYKQVVGSIYQNKLDRPCRIYAPIGKYKTLLPYLVRRLLENGANSSFVNQITKKNVNLKELVCNPIEKIIKNKQIKGKIGIPHKKIPLPRFLYGENRKNSYGIDLNNEKNLKKLSEFLITSPKNYIVTPLLSKKNILFNQISKKKTIINPANQNDIIGYVYDTPINEINNAIKNANKALDCWKKTTVQKRSKILIKTAKLIEKHFYHFIAILVRESGKTYHNAISEIRESIDFLRYYAQQIQENINENQVEPLGIVICISPWNFPLAIFIGQISAALATGNVVLAKPAEQTPIVAMLAVKLLYKSGIPKNVLQMLTGKGSIIGKKIIEENIDGVIFTGSNNVAKIIHKCISQKLNRHNKPITFIAETGGLNTMIIDSSALTEQVINDVIVSAFDSSGQRCSAMRLLCVQEEVFKKTINMLKEAVVEYSVGNPTELSTDIGPIINRESKENIIKYINKMKKNGNKIYQSKKNKNGNFITPTIIEIKYINELKNEIFGPVLHVLKYKKNEIKKLIKNINNLGYGLTFGLHTRIDKFANYISKKIKAGNIYINRNMIGAVVGVQPFGGEGLSGTGPKAGGPLYIYKLLNKYKNIDINKIINKSNKFYKLKNWKKSINRFKEYDIFLKWAKTQNDKTIEKLFNKEENNQKKIISNKLIGPTGELNKYFLIPRKKILFLAKNKTDIFNQIFAALKIGCEIIWQKDLIHKKINDQLPKEIQKKIHFTEEWEKKDYNFDFVIHHGDKHELKEICKKIANKEGKIIGIQSFKQGDKNLYIENLFHERVISINTSATGGDINLIRLD